MAEIVPVVSEALEAKVRDLLPSQRGFGEDLQASNVILPIIDLTAAAEAASTPAYLQRAWDFSTGHTNWNNTNATVTLINTTGFWQVDVNAGIYTGGVGTINHHIQITDGLTNKIVWQQDAYQTGSANHIAVSEQSFVVFLRAGDSLTLTHQIQTYGDVWYRQIADVNGDLVYPLGFTPQ